MEDLELKIIENEFRKRKLLYTMGDNKQREYLNTLRDQINLTKSRDIRNHNSIME